MGAWSALNARTRRKTDGPLAPKYLLEGQLSRLDKFVTHRSTDFGIGKQRALGDGW